MGAADAAVHRHEGLPARRPDPRRGRRGLAGQGRRLTGVAADRRFFDAAWNAIERVEQTLYVRLPLGGTAAIELGTSDLARAVEGLIPATAPDQPPELTVRVISVPGSRRLPPIPWDADDVIARGDVPSFGDDDLRASQRHNGAVVAMLDATRGRAVAVVRDPERIPANELAAPLRPVLSWWLNRRGFGLLHAGCVAGARGAAMLGGRSRSGKSTLSLAAAAVGLAYVGDDYVALGRSSTVHAVYRTGHLEADSLRMLEGLETAVVMPPAAASKAVMVFRPGGPVTLTGSADVTVIVLPERRPDQAPRLERVSPATALAALAPSSVIQFPGGSPQSFHMLGSLARLVPSYRLVYDNAVAAAVLLTELVS